MTTESTLHGTCVAYDQSGLLIIGTSGSGKSGLALALMGMNAVLVADDRVIVTNDEGVLFAQCPPAIKGLIEARGIGLLAAKSQPSTLITCVVDLDQIEPDRLPPNRSLTILGVEIDLVFGKDRPNLAAALNQLMKIGRVE
ncbi:MAG: HPr kinase/phosphatase C-terminal domain-containing protein [Rhodobacteraceae bacterium]|nr:HPr kinase/phosphatase C-terminal domain-containing protein [Paracoccaceae bacterium]